jgi:hypothetical protein
MTIIYYLYILAPFAALFALGYFPVVLLDRLLAKRRLVESADAWAPFAGTLGTVVGFLFYGLNEYDRFGLAPDHVRMAWQNSGSAYFYEMGQALFSGAVCALVLVVIARFLPRLSQNSRIATPVAALLISFIDFSFWPVFLSPFL